MKRKLAIWLSVGMLVLGLGVMLYPAISSAINHQHGSYAIQQLQRQLEDMDAAELEAELELARTYNAQLRDTELPDEERYGQILDFGNGIMGYLTVEKIGLMLPIYHGVSTEVLEKGVGHLPSSHFPIGGVGNHTVLTGHTGLPSAKLFTDLVELAEGDRFCVTVGSHSVFYQVDQISVVLPQETEDLMAVAGEDYCTLVTCTPYGVNSHRLLVRGSRMEVAEEPVIEDVTMPTPERRSNRWLFLLLLLPLSFVLIWKRKKESHG